jgi:hypothetical protein
MTIRAEQHIFQIYEGLRPEIDAFRQLPGVEIVPGRAFKTWLPQTEATLAQVGTGQEIAGARRCQKQETQSYGRLKL